MPGGYTVHTTRWQDSSSDMPSCPRTTAAIAQAIGKIRWVVDTLLAQHALTAAEAKIVGI